MESVTREQDVEQFDAFQNSGLLDSLYDSLNMKDRAVAYYKRLPPEIKGRIRALKKLQFDTLKVEVEFYKELGKLEQRFVEKHRELFAKRKAIIVGDIEPTEDEISKFEKEFPDIGASQSFAKSGSDGDAPSHFSPELNEKCNAKGIPGFWLNVLRNAPLICDNITPQDANALKYLLDVRSVPVESEEGPGFELEFEFAPNEYFTNKILTKRYIMSYELKDENPLMYDGPEVISSKGCTINWNPGKELTKLVATKTQQFRMCGERKPITRAKNIESFFQFFNPPKAGTDKNNPALEQKLMEDYDLGQYLKERVIPRAVIYYTGEALDLYNELNDDEFPDEDFDDESEEELDEEDDH